MHYLYFNFVCELLILVTLPERVKIYICHSTIAYAVCSHSPLLWLQLFLFHWRHRLNLTYQGLFSPSREMEKHQKQNLISMEKLIRYSQYPNKI